MSLGDSWEGLRASWEGAKPGERPLRGYGNKNENDENVENVENLSMW